MLEPAPPSEALEAELRRILGEARPAVRVIAALRFPFQPQQARSTLAVVVDSYRNYYQRRALPPLRLRLLATGHALLPEGPGFIKESDLLREAGRRALDVSLVGPFALRLHLLYSEGHDANYRFSEVQARALLSLAAGALPLCPLDFRLEDFGAHLIALALAPYRARQANVTAEAAAIYARESAHYAPLFADVLELLERSGEELFRDSQGGYHQSRSPGALRSARRRVGLLLARSELRKLLADLIR